MSLNIPEIEAIKTVTIAGQFLYSNATPTQFTAPVYSEVVPDVIILRRAVYTDLDQSDSEPINLVKSDLVNGNVLYSFNNVSAGSDICDTHFTQFKIPHGTMTFYLTNYAGNQIKNPTTVNTTISFTFEFIKYKAEKK